MTSLPFQSALDDDLSIDAVQSPEQSATDNYWMPCRQRWFKPRLAIPYPFEMRRKVNGKWEYRLPTVEEVAERSSTDHWPMRGRL
jgi:hypothetical protein